MLQKSVPAVFLSNRLFAFPFRVLVISKDEILRDGYLIVKNGRVAGYAQIPPRGANCIEPPGDVLIPGLVNAHAHLRFSHLAGAIPRGGLFTNWIESILASPPPNEGDAERGAREMLQSGITTIGDHDSDGSGAAVMLKIGLSGVAFREFFAFDPTNVTKTASTAARAARSCSRGAVAAGLAPHAPFTVSLQNLKLRSALPISLHFVETSEERRFIEKGGGPIDALLQKRGRRPLFTIPNCNPVDLLENCPLFERGAALVHSNVLTRNEVRRLAAAGRFVAIHCAGTHRYFGRGDTPVADWVQAKLPFALGTDSLASNDRLDLFNEMALLQSNDPRIPSEAIFDAATAGGARALRLRRKGTLAMGNDADFVALKLQMKTRGAGRSLARDLFDALCARPKVAAVYTIQKQK